MGQDMTQAALLSNNDAHLLKNALIYAAPSTRADSHASKARFTGSPQ
jgi:hypothetical protein